MKHSKACIEANGRGCVPDCPNYDPKFDDGVLSDERGRRKTAVRNAKIQSICFEHQRLGAAFEIKHFLMTPSEARALGEALLEVVGDES
jgi:hypothetical protein